MSMSSIMYENNKHMKQINCYNKMLEINVNLIPMPIDHTLFSAIGEICNEGLPMQEKISYKVFNYILLYLQKDNINELVDKYCVCKLTDDIVYDIFKNIIRGENSDNEIEQKIYDYLLSIINKDNLFKIAVGYLSDCEYLESEKVLREEYKTVIYNSIDRCLKTFADKEY